VSVHAADGKTYDERGRLLRHTDHSSIGQSGELFVITENIIYDNSRDHIFDNNLNPVYQN